MFATVDVVHFSEGQFQFPGLRLLELGAIADRLHCLADCFYDNVRPINDDEMPALLRNDLLAVLRKRQQFGLQLGGARTVNRRDIYERLVAERVAVFSGDRVRLRNTFRHHFMV
jgi:hypothetical protein